MVPESVWSHTELFPKLKNIHSTQSKLIAKKWSRSVNENGIPSVSNVVCSVHDRLTLWFEGFFYLIKYILEFSLFALQISLNVLGWILVFERSLKIAAEYTRRSQVAGHQENIFQMEFKPDFFQGLISNSHVHLNHSIHDLKKKKLNAHSSR